jgi:hypothetical protein
MTSSNIPIPISSNQCFDDSQIELPPPQQQEQQHHQQFNPQKEQVYEYQLHQEREERKKIEKEKKIIEEEKKIMEEEKRKIKEGRDEMSEVTFNELISNDECPYCKRNLKKTSSNENVKKCENKDCDEIFTYITKKERYKSKRREQQDIWDGKCPTCDSNLEIQNMGKERKCKKCEGRYIFNNVNMFFEFEKDSCVIL